MPPRSSPLKDTTIAALLEVGTPIPKISPMVGVTEPKARKVRDNLWDFGTTRAPQLVTRGLARFITAAMVQALRELLEVRPSLFIDELLCICYDEFDVMVSEIMLR